MYSLLHENNEVEFSLLLKIDFIVSRQPITAKFAELGEIATAIIHVQTSAIYDNPDLFT